MTESLDRVAALDPAFELDLDDTGDLLDAGFQFGDHWSYDTNELKQIDSNKSTVEYNISNQQHNVKCSVNSSNGVLPTDSSIIDFGLSKVPKKPSTTEYISRKRSYAESGHEDTVSSSCTNDVSKHPRLGHPLDPSLDFDGWLRSGEQVLPKHSPAMRYTPKFHTHTRLHPARPTRTQLRPSSTAIGERTLFKRLQTPHRDALLNYKSRTTRHNWLYGVRGAFKNRQRNRGPDDELRHYRATWCCRCEKINHGWYSLPGAGRKICVTCNHWWGDQGEERESNECCNPELAADPCFHPRSVDDYFHEKFYPDEPVLPTSLEMMQALEN